MASFLFLLYLLLLSSPIQPTAGVRISQRPPRVRWTTDLSVEERIDAAMFSAPEFTFCCCYCHGAGDSTVTSTRGELVWHRNLEGRSRCTEADCVKHHPEICGSSTAASDGYPRTPGLKEQLSSVFWCGDTGPSSLPHNPEGQEIREQCEAVRMREANDINRFFGYLNIGM